MQTGYVFLCNTDSMTECMRSKRFGCSSGQGKTAQDLDFNTVIFLYNVETGTLLGPFSVAEEPEDLEKGAWYSSIDEESLSENIKVEWENLHELKNAPDKVPFLKNTKECALSTFQTQELLTALAKAPLFSES